MTLNAVHAILRPNWAEAQCNGKRFYISHSSSKNLSQIYTVKLSRLSSHGFPIQWTDIGKSAARFSFFLVVVHVVLGTVIFPLIMFFSVLFIMVLLSTRQWHHALEQASLANRNQGLLCSNQSHKRAVCRLEGVGKQSPTPPTLLNPTLFLFLTNQALSFPFNPSSLSIISKLQIKTCI